jgi:cell division protein FtsZ
MDLTLFEVDEAANRIRSEVDPDANIIVGSTFSDALEGRMRVSVVATGIEAEPRTLDVMRNDPAAGRVAPKVRPLSSSSTVMTPPPNPVNTQLRNLAERVQSEIPAAREKAEQRPATEEKGEPARAAREEVPAASEAQQAARPAPARAETPAAEHPREAPMVRERRPEPPILGPADRPTVAARTDESGGQGGGILGTRKRKRASNFFERMTAASGILGGGASAQPVQQPRMGGEGEAAERRVAERTAPSPRAREPKPESSPGEKLLPATFEEEQLEIPAFLRRQAN